jgi:hypothetical protein
MGIRRQVVWTSKKLELREIKPGMTLFERYTPVQIIKVDGDKVFAQIEGDRPDWFSERTYKHWSKVSPGKTKTRRWDKPFHLLPKLRYRF